MKILIADDNRSFRLLVESTLKKQGYETMSVADGIAALKALQDQDGPKLAILDVNMPGLDGTDICQRLRQTDAELPVYIILLTANSTTAELVAGLQAGADDYVTKPFDREELLARVQVGVRIVELQRRLAEHVTEVESASKQLQRHAQFTQLNADIRATLTEVGGVQSLLQQCAENISATLQAAHVCFWTPNTSGEMLELQAHAGSVPAPADGPASVPVAEGWLGELARSHKPQLSDGLPAGLSDIQRAWVEQAGIKSYAGYPLWVEDRLVGVLTILTLASLADDTKEALGSVVATIAQGLDRKRAEEALRVSEEKYRSLIANIPDVTWTADEHGNMLFISPNVEKVEGFTAEEVINNPDHCFVTIHPEDLQNVEDAYHKFFHEGEEFDVHYRVKRKDGLWIWIHDRAVATYEKDGRKYADGVFSDITERKLVEEALRLSQEHLQRAQKLESIGQLAAGIAHEINTPMQYLGDNLRFLQDSFNEVSNVLDSYAELLLGCKTHGAMPELTDQTENTVAEIDVDYLREEVPKALQQSLEGVERVSKIVQSMKDFAHPGFKKKPADLNKAIESTLTVARNEWKYVADVLTHFDEHLPPVPCVLSELNQVILNVIINAAHAIADVVGDGSQGKGTIIISTKHRGDWAEIMISDTGTGIPEAIRGRIFDPFFTTKEVGKGTGQGLAISHSVIVEKHQGTIDFNSEEGRGTTFIIRLPLNEQVGPQ